MLWWINESSSAAVSIRKFVREWHTVVLLSSEIARVIHYGLTLWNPIYTVILDTDARDRLMSCIILFSQSSFLQYHTFVPAVAGLPLGGGSFIVARQLRNSAHYFVTLCPLCHTFKIDFYQLSLTFSSWHLLPFHKLSQHELFFFFWTTRLAYNWLTPPS